MDTTLRPHTPTERDILRLIERKCGQRVLSADTGFQEVQGFKNIDYIEVVMELETANGIDIPDEIAWSVTTPAELARYIDRQRHGNFPL